jgi:uncharacterized membrane protein
VHLILPRALTTGALLWVALLLAAPAALSHEWASGLAGHLYAASSHICHQRPERSFALAGVQLPVCARCFGLYVSGALGALAAWVAVPRPLPAARILLAVAALPTGVTWALEAAGLAGFSNVTRAGAALPLGACAGWVFVQMLRYDAESHGRKVHDSRTAARLG